MTTFEIFGLSELRGKEQNEWIFNWKNLYKFETFDWDMLD